MFLERCLQLLKPGGRMEIVLPESILGNPSYEFLIAFIQTRARVMGVVTMPEALFKTSGKGGTHTKVAVLLLRKEKPSAAGYEMFMGDVKWCGHNSRGNPTLREGARPQVEVKLLDEVPLVAKRYATMASGITARDHLGYALRSYEIRNRILVPKYYDPEIERDLKALEATRTPPGDNRSVAEVKGPVSRYRDRDWQNGVWDRDDPFHPHVRPVELGN